MNACLHRTFRFLLTPALSVLLLTSCATRRAPVTGPYRLERAGVNEPLLIPPHSPVPGPQSTIRLDLGKIRQTRRRAVNCNIKAGAFDLTFVKSKATLTVDTGDMKDSQRIPLSVLDDIEKFRASLIPLEANNCLAAGQAGLLLERIVESLTLPPRIAYYLRHGTSVNSGFVDIEPPFRMKVVAPLKSDRAVDGYETAWYGLEDRGAKGYRLKVERVETSRKGKVAQVPTPSAAKLDLGTSVGFYRLFFLTRRAAADHDILLTGAATKKILEEVSPLIRREGEPACRSLQSRHVTCLQIPTQSAVSAELRVKAQQQWIYVHFTGSVADALKAAGVPRGADVLATLRVMRAYGRGVIPVEFDRAKPDILSLTLIGGEEITW